MPKIKITDTLTRTQENRMQEDLIRFESSKCVDVNYKRFSIILTDDQDETIGIIDGFTAYAELYIDDMWVHVDHRLHGYGKQMLTALESHFEGQGYNNINLCTSEFQAPHFYEKCGYALEFVRKNSINPLFTKYFFIKYFKNSEQNQGLIK